MKKGDMCMFICVDETDTAVQVVASQLSEITIKSIINHIFLKTISAVKSNHSLSEGQGK